MPLQESDRLRLDGVVQQMVANKEPDENIQLVVDDFKNKYGNYSQPSNVPTSSAMFPYSSGDTAITAALKAAGNTPQSAFNFARGAVSAVNPLNTLKTIAQIPGEFGSLVKEKGSVKGALGATAQELPRAAYEGLIPQVFRQLIAGDIQGAGETQTNDPVAGAAPVVLALLGGAKGLDSRAGTNLSPTLNAGVSKLAQTVTKPTSKVATGVSSGAKSLTRSAASQLTGMEPQTISQVIANPKAFSKVAQDNVSRGGLANQVGGAIETLAKDLNETGKGYNTIRESAFTTKLPDNFFTQVLSEHGLKVSKEGKITADTNSITRNPADINSLQSIYDNWGNKKYLTSREFLNLRSDLGQLSKFDAAKSGAANTVGKDLYAKVNEQARPQIPGLKEADAAYKPQLDQLKEIRRDYLKKDVSGDWVFKDGAVNKIANLTGAGKQQVLSRLEGLVPGVTKQIQILKAVEDIAKAKGSKVGTYTRSAIAGGGLLTGNVPAIISAIVSNPTVAVPLLRSSSITGSKLSPILQALKTIGGDVNHLKVPSVKRK